jgi:capsular exopolysaccharide synthesis family protein
MAQGDGMTITSDEASAGSSLVSLLRLLRRRKVLVFLPPLVLLAFALAHSFSQSALYQGQADVLLSRVNLQNSVNNQSVVGITADQFFQIQSTQAALAHTPLVARRVLAQAHVTDLTPRQFLDRSEVVPDRAKDLLHFRVRDRSASRAQRLSQIFARQYVAYRRELDTAPFRTASARILQTLKGLNPNDRSFIQSLTGKEQELRTLEALQSGNAVQVPTSANVSKVQPRTTRDAIIAVLLGLFAGVGLAFLREVLDTRVRTPEEVGHILHLPFLGYLQPPPKAPAGQGKLTMLESPNSPDAESFRILALNLQFTNLVAKARSIMISSAVDAEGKSVTISNLAVALARSGNQVALADFDLRKPTLHTLFGLGQHGGVTDVILGHKTLGEIGNRIELNSDADASRPQSGGDGGLMVFPAGTLPPNPGEFLSSAELGVVIRGLRGAYDYLLLDAPPLLPVGDPLNLSTRVDAMFLVTRFGVVRKPVLRELERVLKNAPVSLLGFAATGSGAWLKSYGYELSYGYERPLGATTTADSGARAPMPADPERATSPSPRSDPIAITHPAPDHPESSASRQPPPRA